MAVAFDGRSATEAGHDYVKFFADEARTRLVGADKYTGLLGSNNFPTAARPLLVRADSVVLHFHSDGSNVDWGYRLVRTGTCGAYYKSKVFAF